MFLFPLEDQEYSQARREYAAVSFSFWYIRDEESKKDASISSSRQRPKEISSYTIEIFASAPLYDIPSTHPVDVHEMPRRSSTSVPLTDALSPTWQAKQAPAPL